ncbi:MAG: YihY/virulence factor BrkB family protein [Bacteroidales bacterium]|nr:YihY/virulence factor BrkB family protein [Bacteroidales bacterium]
MMSFKELFAKITAKVREIYIFLAKDIWFFDFDDISHPAATLANAYKFCTAMIRDFGVKKIGIMSASLSYFTAMAVVPFIAVCFALTGGLGLEDLVYEILYSNIDDPYVIQLITDAAGNIINSAKKGGFGLVSALLFVWLVIWMMNRVEKVFNDIWRIEDKTVEMRFRNRKRRKSITSYGVDLTILLFAPFMVLLFFSGSIVYSQVLDIVIPNNIGFSNEIKTFVSWLIFALISILVLSAMYKYIPSTKVMYKNAFKGAIVAGIAFTVLQFLYLETQVLVTRINAVYGTIAAIPLLLVWMRFGWLITVLGGQISYSLQNKEKIIQEAIKS